MTNHPFHQIVEAANDNDGFAITLLGVILINCGEDVEDGINRIVFAADAKNVLWAKCLKLYLRGFKEWQLPIHHYALVDSDAIEQLQIYSREGNIWAMAILGDLLFHGKVVPQKREEASELLCEAANNGCLLAKDLIDEYRISPKQMNSSNLFDKFKEIDNRKFWLK